MPAHGPGLYHAPDYEVTLAGGSSYRTVVDAVQAAGGYLGSFPSLHAGGSVFLCLWDLRDNRLRGLTFFPLVVLIYASTLFLRYHYVVDLIVGTLLAASCLPLGRWAFRHWVQRRLAAGLPALPEGDWDAIPPLPLPNAMNTLPDNRFPSGAASVAEQLDADCDTLREVSARLDHLEATLDEARVRVAARQRGYFTPDEDDQVRQMLLAYRNYRLALYEIIGRAMDYDQLGQPVDQLRGLMVGYAAALVLYRKSLKLIETYEHEPLVRQKLNEPDAKFGLEAGFFEDILSAYTSLYNYRLLARAGRAWRQQRRLARDLGLDRDPRYGWLADAIRRNRSAVRRSFWKVLRQRLRRDWRVIARSALRPIRGTRYSLQSLVGSTFAGVRTTLHYVPAIDAATLTQLRATLQPGDVLLTRSEQKLTTTLLPGFWTHAALYIGGRRELEALAICQHPYVGRHAERIPADGGAYGYVLEAISPRVRVCPLEHCLYADHVVALRPSLPEPERREALAEAFGHLDKPYDFEFDFNVTSRIVCTELVYRSYHRRGTIAFELVKRLGRFTLSCDDIMAAYLQAVERAGDAGPRPFDVVALVLQGTDRKARPVPVAEALATLRAIQGGFRPNR